MEAVAIAPDTVVTLSYALFDEQGEAVEEPGEPVTYVHGYAQIVPGLERQMEGLHPGDRRAFTIAADEAFGERDEDAVFEVDKSDFPDPASVEVGDEFAAEGPDGEPFPMRVVEIRAEGFLVDANHPLAGKKLRCEVEVSAVRPASEDEIAAAQAALEEDVDGGCGCGHDHDHDHDHDHGDEDDDHDHEHVHVPLIQLRKTS